MQLSHGQKLLNRCAIEKEKPIGCINDYAMQPGMILILTDNPSEIRNVSFSSWLAYFMKSTERAGGFSGAGGVISSTYSVSLLIHFPLLSEGSLTSYLETVLFMLMFAYLEECNGKSSPC